jgi:hypothetical protein
MSITHFMRALALVTLLLPRVSVPEELALTWPEHWEYRQP